MIVKVNNKEMEFAENSTLLQLSEQLEVPAKGAAMAVNNRMIPRTEWDSKILQENDQVVIIKAACGG